MFFFALFLDVPRLKIEKQSKKLCVKLIEMFARTQCRYLYIYTVYLYANKADSSCSCGGRGGGGGSNTEAAADYSYAPLAHKFNCIKIINGITRVSVARCVSTHAHPSPAHTPTHTSGAQSGVQASPVEGFASPISNYYL